MLIKVKYVVIDIYSTNYVFIKFNIYFIKKITKQKSDRL